MLNPVEAINVGRIHTVNVMGIEEVNRHGLIQSNPQLSFVTAPAAIAAAAAVTSAPVTTPASTYMPMPIPGTFESAFTQTNSFATPLVYPTTAYYPAAIPSPSPCTFLTTGPPITAVCHCVYAQPCALHHRPLTYAPRSFPAITGTVASVGLPHPAHTHVPQASGSIPLVQVPVLPSTVSTPNPVRTGDIRPKRPAVHNSGPSSAPSDPTTSIHAPKVRRLSPTDASSISASASASAYQSNLPMSSRSDDTIMNVAPSGSTNFCDCRCRGTTTDCAPCLCHLHCRQHQSYPCMCPSASTRRESEINNPVHDVLLSSRMAQVERERQATSAWFHRQALAPGSLVGVDVVTPRVAPHPFVMLPRSYNHSLMELSMASISYYFVLLQAHDAAVVVGAAPAQSTETLPVGATLDQIQRYSTKHKYVKDCSLPENEQERCTVCLMDFETEDEVRSLRCDHVFHVSCIDRWLIYNKKCPVCRLDLDKA
uniref:RING-type E3 ubiquitin transferase n=1 Tax=Syphacia muris TaxID=451379 RepID=A0A0N5AA58_9BILA